MGTSKRHSSKPTSVAGAQWQKLNEQFRGDARLEADMLYALPNRLVYEIRRVAPAILTDEDCTFELKLRETSATGFWRQREFFSEALDGDTRSSEFPASAIIDEEKRDYAQLAHKVMDIMATDRFEPALTERRENLRQQLRQQIRQKLKGYIGWLVTHPAFRVEVFRLWFAHSKRVRRPAGLPTRSQLRRLPVKPGCASDRVRDFRMNLSSLLNRWALDSLTTWNLPEPSLPGLFTDDEIPKNGMSPTGVSMFVPWPLMVDHTLTLREMADYYRSKVDLRHLEEWIRGVPRWGFDRFGRMLDLYVYNHLGLAERYGDRLRGQTAALDRAFAAYWEPAGMDARAIERRAEGTRKIRQKMNARLNACRKAIEHDLARIESGEPIWPRDDDSDVGKELAELEQAVVENKSGSDRRGRKR